VDNDGCNALTLLKSKDAVRVFWVQLKMMEALSLGHRLKDMPDDWFTLPVDGAVSADLFYIARALASARLLDAHRFAAADELMARLLADESAGMGLSRCQVTCDRIFLELLGPARPEVLAGFLTGEQQKLMKAMKTNLSVLRTAYALALLSERDAAKAQKIAADFDRLAAHHPYPCEAEGERELMRRARDAQQGIPSA
jgi:hypothetical protein